MTRNSRLSHGSKGRRVDLVRRSMRLSSNDLGRRVVNGATYTFLGIFLRTAMTLGSTAVLARLLTPADFGYIAMATVVTELAALFSNFGFSSLLIQRKVISRLHLDTVFWTSLALGVLLTLAVLALSFPSRWIFSDPLVGDLLMLLSLTFLIGNLSVVHQSILARLMQFRTTFWVSIGVVAIRILAAIGFASQGFGVWSLVAGAIAGSLAGVTLSALVVPYWPRLRFSSAYLMSTWRTSASYFGSGMLYYVSMNADLFLIGRSLGAGSLGFYQNARSLTDEVRARIAMPLQRVLFPAFSAMQTERARLQDSVRRSGRILAAIICPIGVGLAAVSEELVPVLYGEQWLPMVPILGLLGISAALRGSTAIASPLFNSQNRVGLALRYNIIGTVILLAGIVVSLPYGLNAVAATVAVSSLYSLVTFRAGLGLIGLNTRDAIRILGGPLIASLLMWGCIEIIRHWTSGWTDRPALLLSAHVGTGAAAYAVLLHLVSPQYLNDFRDLAVRLLRKS